MNANVKPISKSVAVAELAKNGDILNDWLKSDNTFLRELATEVIAVASGGVQK